MLLYKHQTVADAALAMSPPTLHYMLTSWASVSDLVLTCDNINNTDRLDRLDRLVSNLMCATTSEITALPAHQFTLLILAQPRQNMQ